MILFSGFEVKAAMLLNKADPAFFRFANVFTLQFAPR
jgi:hypothetical protein